MSKNIILLFLFTTISTFSFSQDQRIADDNNINWLVYNGDFSIGKKTTLHTEYQWRRVDGFKNWQQGLFRTGLHYAISKDVSINAGYAFAETFGYGDYPAAYTFPEHRIYEQLVIKNPIGKLDLSHRFTLEQRFLGKVSEISGIKNTDYFFLNRMRYRVRGELPIASNHWSVILQDEIFIGWGKNMGTNIFDQNRIGILLGYKLNKQLKIECGYINQTLQQSKRINDKAVFQYNNGLLLACNFSLNIKK